MFFGQLEKFDYCRVLINKTRHTITFELCHETIWKVFFSKLLSYFRLLISVYNLHSERYCQPIPGKGVLKIIFTIFRWIRRRIIRISREDLQLFPTFALRHICRDALQTKRHFECVFLYQFTLPKKHRISSKMCEIFTSFSHRIYNNFE